MLNIFRATRGRPAAFPNPIPYNLFHQPRFQITLLPVALYGTILSPILSETILAPAFRNNAFAYRVF